MFLLPRFISWSFILLKCKYLQLRITWNHEYHLFFWLEKCSFDCDCCNVLSESVKKGKFMAKIFFSNNDNVKSSSKNLLKMIVSLIPCGLKTNVKQQGKKELVAVY